MRPLRHRRQVGKGDFSFGKFLGLDILVLWVLSLPALHTKKLNKRCQSQRELIVRSKMGVHYVCMCVWQRPREWEYFVCIFTLSIKQHQADPLPYCRSFPCSSHNMLYPPGFCGRSVLCAHWGQKWSSVHLCIFPGPEDPCLVLKTCHFSM